MKHLGLLMLLTENSFSRELEKSVKPFIAVPVSRAKCEVLAAFCQCLGPCDHCFLLGPANSSFIWLLDLLPYAVS